MAALTTGHVHASFILLNGLRTARTRLGIVLDPYRVQVLFTIKDILPFDQTITGKRQMRIFSTVEAKGLRAVFAKDICLPVFPILNSCITVASWTPFRVFRQLYK